MKNNYAFLYGKLYSRYAEADQDRPDQFVFCYGYPGKTKSEAIALWEKDTPGETQATSKPMRYNRGC